jgi:hypothetical protein
MPYWFLVILFTSFNAGMFGANVPAKQNPPATVVALPAYPDTAGGLEHLVADILRDSKNDPAKYSALVSNLSQPVPAEWFRNTFGDDGDTMLRDYPDAPPRVMSALHALFVKVRDESLPRLPRTSAKLPAMTIPAN